MKCLECSTEVPQTPGKRAKQFCNNTCRVKYWQKKKKEQSGPSQKKAGRPKKVLLNTVSPTVSAAMFNAEHPNQHTEVYDLTPEQFKEKFGHNPVSLDLPSLVRKAEQDTRKVLNPDDPKTKQMKEPEEGTNAFFLKYGVFNKKDIVK